MKNTIRGIMFWTIVIASILLMTAIAQALASVISMKQIMFITYLVLGYSFIYILKN